MTYLFFCRSMESTWDVWLTRKLYFFLNTTKLWICLLQERKSNLLEKSISNAANVRKPVVVGSFNKTKYGTENCDVRQRCNNRLWLLEHWWLPKVLKEQRFVTFQELSWHSVARTWHRHATPVHNASRRLKNVIINLKLQMHLGSVF